MNRRLTTLACCLVATAALTASVPKKNDFNGDGKSDILFTKGATSAIWEEQIFNSSIAAQGLVHTPATKHFVMVATGDVNKDGMSDLFWRNTVTGDVWLQIMNGLSVTSSTKIATEANLDWQIVLASDFNGDGTADLLWRNTVTGALYMQFLGTTGTPLATSKLFYTEPNPDWRPVATKGQDLFWKNEVSGAVYLMTLGLDASVSATSKVIYTEPDPDWKIVAADDFNNDGLTELLWWNSTSGKVYLQTFNADYTVKSGSVIWTEPSTLWNIVATGDYNGDGIPDLLWANTNTGQILQMFMDSVALGTVNTKDSQQLTIADTGWTVASGITSVAIAPPIITTTSTGNFKWKFVGADANPAAPAVAIPASKIYVTDATAYILADTVLGPQKLGVTWEAWKADGSLLLDGSTTPVSPLSGTTFNSPVVADYLIKAISIADPTKVGTRIISAVADPGATSIVATPTTVLVGNATVLSGTFVGGSAVLSNNIAMPSIPLTASPFSVSVTPTATAQYTLTVTNPAGKTNTSTAVVTVQTTDPALNSAITVAKPGWLAGSTNYITSTSVYAAKAGTGTAQADCTYTWSITGGQILGGWGTPNISFVSSSGTSTVLTCLVTKGAASSSTTETMTVVAAPTVPATVAVQNMGASGLISAATTATYSNNITANTTGNTILVSGAGTDLIPTWSVISGPAANFTYATVTSGNDKLIFDVTGTGTIQLGVTFSNRAGAISSAKVITLTAVPKPVPVITSAGTSYVTTGLPSSLSVTSAGAGAKYTWSVSGTNGSAITGGNIVAVQGTSNSVTFTATGAADGTKDVTADCAVLNAAGWAASATQKALLLCPAAAAPTVVTYPSSPSAIVSKTKTQIAQVTNTGSGTTWNKKTYVWSVASGAATTTAGATTNILNFTPTSTGMLDFTVYEVNAAGIASPSYTTAATNATPDEVTVVELPSASSFGVAKAAVTVSEPVVFNFSFANGTATLFDSVPLNAAPIVVATPIGGIASSQTTYSWGTTAAGNYLRANDNTATNGKHSINLRVTNAAGDYYDYPTPVVVDVVAAPTIANYVGNGWIATNFDGSALADMSVSANALDFGTVVKLSYVAGGTNAGAVVSIVPSAGAITYNTATNPLIGYAYVAPAVGVNNYMLKVANRAAALGVTAANTVSITLTTEKGDAKGTPVVNPVTINAVSNGTTGIGTTPTVLTAATTFVTTAVNKAVTFSIVSDTTGGASFDYTGTSAADGSGTVLTLGSTAGSCKIRVTSVADTSKYTEKTFTNP